MVAFLFFTFEVDYLIPHLAQQSYSYFNYPELGGGPWEAFRTAIVRPWRVRGPFSTDG